MLALILRRLMVVSTMVALLTSCSNSNSRASKDDSSPEYKEPTASSATATITGSVTDPGIMFYNEYWELIGIDGYKIARSDCKFITIVNSENCHTKPYLIKAGKHDIKIADLHDGGIVSKDTVITFTAEAGHTYQLIGEVRATLSSRSYNAAHKDKTWAWVIDKANSNIVSEKVEVDMLPENIQTYYIYMIRK